MVCAIQEGIASVAESSTDRDVPCVEGKQAANSDRRNMSGRTPHRALFVPESNATGRKSAGW